MSHRSRANLILDESYDDHEDHRDNDKKFNKTGLTSEELKLKLIQVVKNKGIFDTMKSQLRNKLVHELNPNLDQIRIKANENGISQKSKSNLALNTINSLIIDHLKTNEYDYSLSVFMPESGLNLNEVYSLNDILHIIKVSPESKLYEKLNNSEVIKSKGLLWHLVSYFCSHYVTHDVSVQTDADGIHNIASNLDFKLKNLDKYYVEMNQNLNSKLSFEEKIVAYQKKLDEKSKTELEQKLKEFKEIELARMRMEEREKLRLDMQSFRSELESTYQIRNESLNQREKSFDELMKQRRELEERELFIQRQHLLDEIKDLRRQEAEFKHSIELQTQKSNQINEKYQKLEDDLKKRESLLKQTQSNIDMLLRDEREKIKLDLERQYAQREFIVQSIETKNKQDSAHNQIERTHLDQLKHEFQQQQIRINEIDLELQKSLGETACLKQENELLKEKLSHCLDYDFIKQENKMLKYKLDVSKEIIGEKNLTGRQPILTNRASGRLTQRKRSVTFDNNNEILTNLNQSEQNQIVPPLDLDPHTEIEDEEKLTMTYREEGDRILSEAVEMKETLENHNLINTELKDLYTMQLYEQRKLYETINDVKHQVDFLFNGISTQVGQHENKKLDEMPKNIVEFDFIYNAKDRLKYLESESERIENSYRDYQHKIKSKYYPIHDDQEKEIRIVNKSNYEPRLDLDKFLESTLKSNLNAKMMREKLENDIIQYENESSKVLHNEVNKQKVDEILKNVQLPFQSDQVSIKKQIEKDENEFKLVHKRYESIISDENTSTHLVTSNKLSNRVKSPIKKTISNSDDEETELKSNNTTTINTNNNNNKFGLNDYVKMFDSNNNDRKPPISSTPSPRKIAEEEKPIKTKIKIEYSESSSSSSSPPPAKHNSSSDSSDSPAKIKNKFSFNKTTNKENVKLEVANDESDDDDFKW